MVELVTVLVMAGILSLMAAPSLLDHTALDSRSFYDQLVSTLRYAQKAALAQYRYICVAFDTGSRITLTYNASAPTSSACSGAPLMSPDGQSAYSVTPPEGVTISIADAGSNPVSLPASFSFSPQGRPLIYVPLPTATLYGMPVPDSRLVSLKQTFAVSGYANPVVVEGETGYVH